MTKRIVALVAVVMAAPLIASAAVHVVDPHGTGDFVSIREAVNAAAAGDRVEVHPGHYAESCTLTVGIELVGTGGAEATVLDGDGSRIIMWIRGATGCTISGMTFTGGYHDSGAAIHMSNAAIADVTECVFRDNHSTWDGGAIYTCQAGTRLVVLNSLFEDNFAHHNGGAMGINTSSYVEITDCEFRGNVSATAGGAVGNHAGAHMTITRCLFVDNEGHDAGAIRSFDSSANISECTIHENVAAAGYSVHLMSSNSVFEKNIVSNSAQTRCLSTYGAHDYNVFVDGFGVPDQYLVLAPHEWYLDPGYCDFAAGNFNLCSTSPALPENNGTCLFGRYPQGCGGCGPVAVEDRIWGSLKAEFR